MKTQRAFARALVGAGAPPAGLATWNGSDPAQRFAIYRNNVIVSLVDALADAFPVVAELVGPDFFRAMAREFARAHPPRSAILARYGDALPAFVERFAPARALPYLADVARLEIAWMQAFHAADMTPLGADAFAAHAAAKILTARAALHPSVRIVSSRYAVASIWLAHRGDGDLAAVDPFVGERALVARPALDVRVRLLDPGGFAFLRALAAGMSVEAALRAAMAADRAFEPRAALALAMTEGLVTGLDMAAEGAAP